MNIVAITSNEFNTFFITVNGELVADSSTVQRVRGFWNKSTQEWTKASKFTKRNIKKDPNIVLPLLAETGTDTTQGIWIVAENV